MCKIKAVFSLQARADLQTSINGGAESRSVVVLRVLYRFFCSMTLPLPLHLPLFFILFFLFHPSALTDSASHQSRQCLLSIKYLVRVGRCVCTHCTFHLTVKQ